MEAEVVTSLSARLLSSKTFPATIKEDDEQDYSAYANGRIGTRPQLAVIFRKADGSARALTYTHLLSVDAESPAAGFIIEFTSQKVLVRGRNLAVLFRLISQHKAAEIVEASRSTALQAPADGPVVETIEFRR